VSKQDLKTPFLFDHAGAGVFDYIELFYNWQRGHQRLNYLIPLEFERVTAA
jgi:transposase InsO family protein